MKSIKVVFVALISLSIAPLAIAPLARGQQVTAVPKGAIRSTPDFRTQSARIASLSANAMRLVRLNSIGTPHIILGNSALETPIVQTNQLEDAAQVSVASTDYLNTQLVPQLALSAQAEYAQVATNRVENVWHSAYQLEFNGIPLRDSRIHVNISAVTGKVMLVRSDAPATDPNTLNANISASDANSLAEIAYEGEYNSDHTEVESPKLVYVSLPDPHEVRLAYETILSDGFHMWRYTLDAISGAILEKRDMVECDFSMEGVHGPYSSEIAPQNTSIAVAPKHQSEIPLSGGFNAPLGQLSGTVFAMVHPSKPTDALVRIGVPEVYVTVNGTRVRTDSTGRWTATGSYPVTLATNFTGPYHKVVRKDGIANASMSTTIQSGSLDVVWNDSNSYAAERDAFYSAAIAREHALDVAPELTKLSQMLTVYVNENQVCNAFYQPGDVSLNFFVAGGGCANTAEISDVVEHEFGHRVNHVRFLLAGSDYMKDLTLNEGFADLHSNFLRDDPIIGKGFMGSSSILRNSQNTKMWPKDITTDGHMSGEIISGAIWDFRKLVGRDVAEHIFNYALSLAPDGVGLNDPKSLEDAFDNVLMSMLLTDDDDGDLSNGTPHAAELLKAFQLHNIGIQNFFSLYVTPIADADLSAQSYPVSAHVEYNGVIGDVDPNSVLLHYSIDNGKTYSTVPLTRGAVPADYSGSIPGFGGASRVVRYYVSAGTNYTDAGSAIYPPVLTQPLAFLVGYESKYLDPCEQLQGWSMTATASQGLWVLDKPYGTFDPDGIYVQQDTDHSANGSQCYLTGNGNAGAGSDDPTIDDVKNGTVTLTTDALDMTLGPDPVVRFWYYFRNDAGPNAGAPVWTTQYSTDGGTTWKAFRSTNWTTKGWVPEVLRLRDVTATANAKFKFRFVASDKVAAQEYPQQAAPPGTIVEAGVDDIEVFAINAAAVASTLPAQEFGIYPSPAHAGDIVQVVSGVTLSESKLQSVTLVDELGQAIHVQTNIPRQSGGFSLTLPKNLATGVYYLRLSLGGQTESKKLLIW